MTTGSWLKNRAEKQEINVVMMRFRVTKMSRLSELGFPFAGKHMWKSWPVFSVKI